MMFLNNVSAVFLIVLDTYFIMGGKCQKYLNDISAFDTRSNRRALKKLVQVRGYMYIHV